MKALSSAIIAVVVSFATAHATTDNGQAIAVDSLGFSVVIPDSTLPSGKYSDWYDGVYGWQYPEAKYPKLWRDTVGRRVVFYAEYTHTRTGACYTVIVRVFSPLFYAQSEDMAMQSEALENAVASECLVTARYYNPVVVNGNPGCSYGYSGVTYGRGNIQGLTVLHGDTLYTLHARVPNAHDTVATREFLASLRLKPGPVASTITTPKGAAFLRFVRTLTARQIAPYHQFYNQKFAETDLPAIYEALRTPFADEQWPLFYSMREHLLLSIDRLDSTPDIAFLSDLYSATDTQSRIRPAIIRTLIRIGTAGSVSEAARLLIDDSPINQMNFLELYEEGRTELARYMLPCIPVLLYKPEWRMQSIRFLLYTLTAGHITATDLVPYSESIGRPLSRYLASYIEWRQTGQLQRAPGMYLPEHGIPTLDIIVASFFCDKSEPLPVLRSLLRDSLVSPYACAALLRCGDRVDHSIVYNLAADPMTRALLYSAMKMTGTQMYFPDQFRSQQSVTASMLVDDFALLHFVPEVEYITAREYPSTALCSTGGRFLYFRVWLPPSLAAIHNNRNYLYMIDEINDHPEDSPNEEISDTPRWHIIMCGPYSSDPAEINADEQTVGQGRILPLSSSVDEELFAKLRRYFLMTYQPG